MQKITHVDQIESPRIGEFFEYWQSKCRDGLLPRRADIDVAEIPRLMPNILIADIEQDPFRVRYRLVGTKVVEATGFEFTGKYLDEITLPDDEGPFLESYRLASESKSAVLARITWHLDDDTTGEYDACFLPLSEDGDVVDKVLCMECYDNVEHDFILAGPGSRPRQKRPD